MRGFLKFSGVIHKCGHCGRLRDLSIEPRECPTCRWFLGIICTAATPMSFVEEVSDDRVDAVHDLLARLASVSDPSFC